MTVFAAPDMRSVRAERARRDLHRFVEYAWPQVEGGRTFVDGRHIHEMCEHLQALYLGQITNLLIMVPPRHMKTLLCSVFFPVWCWLQDASLRFLCATYAQDLSNDAAEKSRALVTSLWFRRNYGDAVTVGPTVDEEGQIVRGRDTVKRFDTSDRGYRISTSVNGPATGRGGDIKIIDDPHKADDAMSTAKRTRALRWYGNTWSTRDEDANTVRSVMIGQRLHEHDLLGYVMGQGGCTVLKLTFRYRSDRPRVRREWRERDGELLWKERFSEAAAQKWEAGLTRLNAAAQLDQEPAPLAGNMFLVEGWRFWEQEPKVDQVVWSWDLSFKAGKENSFVAGYLIGLIRSRNGAPGAKVVLDAYREQVGFSETRKAMVHRYEQTRQQWGSRYLATLVEDKANGPAIKSELEDVIPNMVMVNPMGDKIERAAAITPEQNSGGIIIPHRSVAPWVGDADTGMINRFRTFPNTDFDDEIDALSQGVNWLNAEAMKYRPIMIDPTLGQREAPMKDLNR